MSGLTLLVSYPKSGNTWMRVFLASVELGGRTPDLNADLGRIPTISGTLLNDRIAEMECADLLPAEIARLRPHVARQLANKRPGIFKCHDARLAPPGAEGPAVPDDAIDRVVHIVRDPRDVVVSAAHHFGLSLEAMVAAMNDPAYAIGMTHQRVRENVYQLLSSWSFHAESWLNASGLRRHLVRYEDLVEKPEENFTAICHFLALSASADTIARSITATRFDILAEQESATGFRERSHKSTSPFFRRGRAGGWRDTLPEPLARRIEADHGPMMRRLGYL